MSKQAGSFTSASFSADAARKYGFSGDYSENALIGRAASFLRLSSNLSAVVGNEAAIIVAVQWLIEGGESLVPIPFTYTYEDFDTKTSAHIGKRLVRVSLANCEDYNDQWAVFYSVLNTKCKTQAGLKAKALLARDFAEVWVAGTGKVGLQNRVADLEQMIDSLATDVLREH